MKTKSILGMTLKELADYVAGERKRLGLCEECLGWGKIQDGGVFSRSEKCEICNGTGKKQDQNNLSKITIAPPTSGDR